MGHPRSGAQSLEGQGDLVSRLVVTITRVLAWLIETYYPKRLFCRMISLCFPVQPERSGLSTKTLLKSVFLRTYRNLYKWRDPSTDARILILKKFLCQEGCLAWRVCLPNCFRTSGCCMDVQATHGGLSKL